jgi:hypothetical protein
MVIIGGTFQVQAGSSTTFDHVESPHHGVDGLLGFVSARKEEQRDRRWPANQIG